MSNLKLKRPHFTYHEANGYPWAECPKHDEVYHECFDSGGFDINSDCVGCVIEDRIVEQLKTEITRLEGFVEREPDNEFVRQRLLFMGQILWNQIELIKGETE